MELGRCIYHRLGGERGNPAWNYRLQRVRLFFYFTSCPVLSSFLLFSHLLTSLPFDRPLGIHDGTSPHSGQADHQTEWRSRAFKELWGRATEENTYSIVSGCYTVHKSNKMGRKAMAISAKHSPRVPRTILMFLDVASAPVVPLLRHPFACCAGLGRGFPKLPAVIAVAPSVKTPANHTRFLPAQTIVYHDAFFFRPFRSHYQPRRL
ncbi:uncharacterized protein CC84DRAFT_300963 [Paraphaeosphaeria sporulosa]|uniref:Transmembrane protein n=1 Tax=Paraphaeosphaeria sporulosa TaxID=1460663 RepID=A0A177C0P6_9PLEO|nr:uncharacterized protein CC84DRAFT_300963 [Paraphaeosphaeria sporulosa]OAG00378.1 hypothetical protein CC84DRAFT_300963 [Paraphaeosphaeria sporulosa]